MELSNEFLVSDDDISSGLRDSVVVLTGGSSGIGRATSISLCRNGALVVFGDIDKDGAAETLIISEQRQGRPGGQNGHVDFVKCDTSIYDDVYQLFRFAFEKYGRVDHAISAAAILERGKWIDPNLSIEDVKVPDEEAMKVLNVDLIGTALFARIAVPFLKKSGSDTRSLTLIGSTASFRESSGFFLYQTAKHGVLGLMRSMREPLRLHGIRVNCVCPGITQSGMTARFFDILKQRGIYTQTASEVAHFIMALLRSDLYGKSVYVEGYRAWEFEDSYWANSDQWLGKEASHRLKSNTEFVAKVTFLKCPYSDRMLRYHWEKGDLLKFTEPNS